MYKDTYDSKGLIVWVDMSTYCNAACPECHRTNPNGLGKVDWLPLVQWSIEDFKNLYPPKTMEHIYRFDFCGTFGDPVMAKDIHEILTYIAENSSCRLQIHTNGSMRTVDWWRDMGVLFEDRLDVIFAVEGTSQDQHSFYRQKTDLIAVMNNMEAISATKALVRVFCVVHQHNKDSLYDIASMCKDAGAQMIWFCPSNRFYKGAEKTQFKFVKDNKILYLEKPDVDYDHPAFGRGFNLKNVRDLSELKQMQHQM